MGLFLFRLSYEFQTSFNLQNKKKVKKVYPVRHDHSKMIFGSIKQQYYQKYEIKHMWFRVNNNSIGVIIGNVYYYFLNIL